MYRNGVGKCMTESHFARWCVVCVANTEGGLKCFFLKLFYYYF